MNEIIEINDMDFNKTVIQTSEKKLVLLKFWGNWCQPCKRMNPIFKNIFSYYKNQISIFSINVADNQIITEKFGIKSIPALLFFYKKNLLEKKTGYLSESKVKELIDSKLTELDKIKI